MYKKITFLTQYPKLNKLLVFLIFLVITFILIDIVYGLKIQYNVTNKAHIYIQNFQVPQNLIDDGITPSFITKQILKKEKIYDSASDFANENRKYLKLPSGLVGFEQRQSHLLAIREQILILLNLMLYILSVLSHSL